MFISRPCGRNCIHGRVERDGGCYDMTVGQRSMENGGY